MAPSTLTCQNAQNVTGQTTFRSSDVEKSHAALAPSTFVGQNVQTTAFSEHFLKFRCRTMVRGCGAKHIDMSKCTKCCRADHFSKFRCRKIAHRSGAKHICVSKCTKHCIFRPFFEVQLSKNRTWLCRQAHLQLKMHKTVDSGATFSSSDVKKWHAAVGQGALASRNVENIGRLGALFEVQMSKHGTPLARSAFASQNVENVRDSEPLLTFSCRKSARCDVQLWNIV